MNRRKKEEKKPDDQQEMSVEQLFAALAQIAVKVTSTHRGELRPDVWYTKEYLLSNGLVARDRLDVLSNWLLEKKLAVPNGKKTSAWGRDWIDAIKSIE